jgi:hypothetical protein
VSAAHLHSRAEAFFAKHRLAARTPFAASASVLYPGNTDAVALLARRDTGPQRNDFADRLVAKRLQCAERIPNFPALTCPLYSPIPLSVPFVVFIGQSNRKRSTAEKKNPMTTGAPHRGNAI